MDNIARPAGRTAQRYGAILGNFAGAILPSGWTKGSPQSPLLARVAAQQQINKTGLSPVNLYDLAAKEIEKNAPFKVREISRSDDLVLRAGVWAHDKIFSPITRSLGTVGLLTDFNGPLYTSPEYEKGFQPTDIRRAWNRTELVSLGQTLTKSDLSFLKPLAKVVFNDFTDIDYDEIDLWDDDDIQKAFIDNPVGAWFTGTIDFFGAELGIFGAFKGVGKLGKLAAKGVDSGRRSKNAADFEKAIDEGLEFQASGGTRGRSTAIGRDVETMATSKDPFVVEPLWRNYSNNERLYDVILRSSDPQTVKDLLLADKGYTPALERLSVSAPADLFEIGDTASKLRSMWIENNGVVDLSPKAWERLNAAFDDAINSVPEYRAIKDALMDPATQTPWMRSKPDAIPFTPRIGSELYVAARARAQRFGAAARTRNFDELGGIEEFVLGGSLNGPLTRFVRFTGTYKPTYHVTVSGPRPFDGVAELNAVFDSINLFKNGRNRIAVGPDKYVTASEFRRAKMNEYVSAKTPIEKKNVLDKLDDEFGIVIANSYGFYDTALIRNFVTELKAKIRNSIDPISQNGYAMDYDGIRVMTDAQTQRQLIDSYRVAPWDVIESEIIKRTKSKRYAAGKVGTEVVQDVYESFNKIWTFNILATPKYIVKQSLYEPMIAATISTGAVKVVSEIPSMTSNAIKNNRNRLLGGLQKVVKGPQLKAIDNTVTELSETMNKAVRILDDLTAEASAMLDGSKSPATVAQHYARVQADLRAADRLVDAIELELRDAVRPLETQYFKGAERVPFSQQVPSIANLERRIEFIEKELGPSAKGLGVDVANAKAAISAVKGEINTLVPNPKALFEKNKEIAKQYGIIEEKIAALGDATVRRATLYKKSEEYAKRYYGKEVRYRMIEDQWVPIAGLFDENNFGAILRKEFGNTRTAAMAYVGDLHEGVRQGMVLRNGPTTVTRINDVNYFQELSFITNRYFRGDPLFDQILANAPEIQLLKWAKTDAGKSYFNQFDITTDAQMVNFVRDRVALVNRYIPNENVRLSLTKGDVSPNDLALGLANEFRSGRLSPLHPIDFNYQVAGDFSGYRALGKVEDAIGRGSNFIFSKLVAPENPIRWYLAEEKFADIVARKANELAEMGYKIDPNTPGGMEKLNSLRGSATVEALQEVEKSFYTVRRQNRALYAARLASAFPTATLNAFYRYGRFAMTNPTRVAQFLYAYQSAFRSFGVDQYGNQVDNPLDAEYLLVPLTKQLGFFDGKGVRLSARSFGFLLNFPGPSVYGSVATDKILRQYPEAEDFLKDTFGDMYETFFPFGPQESLIRALTPIWAKDALNWLTGPKGKEDFLASWQSVHDWYKTLDDLGIQEYPGDEQIYDVTKKMWREKALWNFASVFGVPAQANTRPFSIFSDLYTILVNKYMQGGASRDEAVQSAEREFLAKFGDNFQLDRITTRGTRLEPYIAPTTQSFRRVMSDNPKLTEELADLDPKLIGLMTLDLDYSPTEFNLSIHRLLKDPDTRLPGGQVLNRIKLEPQQVEKLREVNRVWEKYNLITEGLEAAAAEKFNGKKLRQVDDLLAVRTEMAETVLREESEDWWNEYQKSVTGDNSYIYAKGISMLVNNKEWMKKYGDSWVFQDLKQFTMVRDIYTQTRKALPRRDPRRTKLREAYEATLDGLIPTWHPKVQSLVTRYFENDTMKVVD
jgi:hypothetical protein